MIALHPASPNLLSRVTLSTALSNDAIPSPQRRTLVAHCCRRPKIFPRGASQLFLPDLLSSVAAPLLHKQTTCWCMCVVLAATNVYWSASRRDEHTTLTAPLPHIMKQPQACSISRSFVAASLLPRQTTCIRCKCMVMAASTVHQSASSRNEHKTLRPPPPCTVKPPQAGSISRSFVAAPLLQRQTTCRCMCVVLTASTLRQIACSRDEHAP